MDRIYRRSTQRSGTPKKKKNEKNRRRNVIINFRVSPMEKEMIDARITQSGLPRAEFFIQSCLYQKILVKGNVRTFSEMERLLEEVGVKIEISPNIEELEPYQAVELRTIAEIIDSRLKAEEKKNKRTS